MNSFILINTSNINELLSLNGIWQIGLIALTWLVAQFTNRYLRLSWYAKYHENNPLLHKLLKSTSFQLVFAIGLMLASIIYAAISGQHSLLGLSIAIFSLGIMTINIINFGISITFAKHTRFTRINNLIKIILWILLICWATNLDAVIADNLSQINLVFGKTKISVWLMIRQLGLVLIDIAIMLWINNIIDSWIKHARELDANLKQLLSRITKVVIVLVGIYILLPTLGINLTALSVFGGAIGVGLGFGLQKIASNFLSGFIILLDKSVKIGDRVIINGTTGVITKITTRYAVMQAFDGSEIIIPNERFITDTIINQTHSQNDISVEFLVSVGYTSDLNLAINTINECVAAIENIRQDKAPSVFIKNLGASGIDIFVRVWPCDSLNESNLVRNKLNIMIVEKFREKNIEIPFPKLDVTLTGSDNK